MTETLVALVIAGGVLWLFALLVHWFDKWQRTMTGFALTVFTVMVAAWFTLFSVLYAITILLTR